MTVFGELRFGISHRAFGLLHLPAHGLDLFLARTQAAQRIGLQQ